MNEYPRYSRIREKMHEALQSKTGWGRNEIESMLARILSEVADEEIQYLTAQLGQVSLKEQQ